MDDVACWSMGTDGPVVVLVHGMEDHWHTWEPIAERLAARYRVFCLDMPWRTANDYGWHAHRKPGEWLAQALAMIPGDVNAIVAHSFGGNATMELLATRADSPGALQCTVLVAPFYRPLSEPDGQWLRDHCEMALSYTVHDGLRVKLGARAAKLDPELLQIMGNGLWRKLMDVAFPYFYQTYVRSGELALTNTAVPTLVLAGTKDLGLFPERAAALAVDMPSSTVRTYPHYGHFCHVEQVDEVAAQVVEFLGRQLRQCGANGIPLTQGARR
jgi:pimeloyl-ACP methyl ester carboxylesterase